MLIVSTTSQLPIVWTVPGVALPARAVATFGLIWLVVIVGYLGGLIFAAVKAYGGNYFKLPVIGNMAEKFANK